MSENITVIKPGTNVVVLGIKAVVRCLMIEGSHVSYKVIWPNGGAISELWVDDFLVEQEDKTQLTIGFR